MKYFIAGGAVRDLLLGRPLRDVDMVFDGAEQDFIQSNPLARKVVDSPRPVYILDGCEYSPLHPGGFTEDMRRRDLTINALALAEDGILHAHPAAFYDLTHKIIRPASEESLKQDPVRAFRVARLFAALPDFSLHAESLAQMRALCPESLLSIAAEQVGKETLKACSASQPGNFLRALAEGGCLAPWFAELYGADAIPAGPPAFHHGRSVLEHIAVVMDGTAQEAADAPFCPSPEGDLSETRALAVWMALCHDLGKVSTAPDVLPRHLGHEERGEAAALALGGRLRLPRVFIKAGALAARLHMKAGRYRILRPGSKVDLLMSVHAAHVFEPFFLMASQDSHNPLLPRQARADLECILNVQLPQALHNKGELSGKRLRELRCDALAHACQMKVPL